MARSNVAGTPDVKAVIRKRLGPLIYEIQTDTGLIWKRHVDHLKDLETVVSDAPPETEEDFVIPTGLRERPALLLQAMNNHQLSQLNQPEGIRKENAGPQNVIHQRLVTDIGQVKYIIILWYNCNL